MFENLEIPKELIPSDPRFGCGPSLIPVDFLTKLVQTDKNLLGTSHRKSKVKNVVKEIQEGLKAYFGVPNDYVVALGNGGATLLFDAVALTLVKNKIAHFTCGEFSNKWYLSSKMVPWIKSSEISVPFGNGITPTDVPDADVIAMTLNETSTGVIIDKVPTVTGDKLIAVDGTSGAGQTYCDVSQTDFFFFSPQKVFASEGGLWVALISPKGVKRINEVAADKSRYIPEIFSLKLAVENGLLNQTYNTPSVTTLFFLNEQVKLLNKMGYKEVVNLANKKADLIYGWAEAKPYLSAYIKEKKYRSNAVACIDVDDKIPTLELVEKLAKLNVCNGIDAYRKLGRNQFRISLFHNISYGDLEKLTKLLSYSIEKAL